MKSIILTSIVAFGLLATAITTSTVAAIKTAALASVKCDQYKIKSIAGDGMISINPMKTGDIYYKPKGHSGPAKKFKVFQVKLDTSKLSYHNLVLKMKQDGCYD